MSESVTAPAEESVYPSLSEATENDFREDVEVQDGAESEPQEDTGGGGDKHYRLRPNGPDPVVTEVEQHEEQPEEPDEEELKSRNARLARTLREEKRRARQLELEAQVLRGQRTEQPDEARQREIALAAAQMAQQQTINAKANTIYTDGVKAYGRAEFDEAVKAVNESFGAQMNTVIDTLIDMDGSEKLIQHLADNPDVADNMALLPPHKLGAALAREAAKLERPKVRPVSKAPSPIRPIATTSSAEPETNMDKMSMEELARMWDKRDAQKRMWS